MGTAELTRTAAQRFLAALDAGQIEAATYPFDDPERLNWTYLPGPRGGLALADMDPAQRDAAHALLRTGLSEPGYRDALAIMGLEPLLGRLERERGRAGWERREPAHYWFSVFGDPGGAVSGWRVGGHHLCVHVTVAGDAVAFLPLFFGANPATAPDGSRVLAAEEDAGRALVLCLDADQRAAAVLSDEAPTDIITRHEARAEITAVPTGIATTDLTGPQRAALAELVGVYTGRPADRLPVPLDDATFAWLGSTRPGEGHYYAVRAGSLVIELDNTQDGANHVHSVIRDTTRDWGEDLLAEHYAARH
jgi:hypothetical protein